MSTVADKLARKSGHQTNVKQVRLRLVHVDFWSAMKVALLSAIAISVTIFVASVLIYLVVRTTGVIIKADELSASFTDGSILVSQFVGLPQVVAFSAVVGLFNLVVVTVLGVIGASLYNLAAKVTGGLLVGFISN